MTRFLLTTTTLALLSTFGNTATALDWFGAQPADVYASTSQLPLQAIGDCGCNGGCGTGDDCWCDDCCCGGWIVDADVLFLQLQGAAFLSDDVFGYDPSTRVVLGYQNANGLGARMRWWDYNHSGTGTNSADTFNIDLEAFQTVQLTDLMSLELSAGVRYNDFRQAFSLGGAPIPSSFSGFGPIVGIKARRQLFGGAVYANANKTIINDDLHLSGVTFFDTKATQAEIGTGYEWWTYTDSGAKLWLRVGYEAWDWTGYAFTVGFSGFVLGGGAQF